jgi:HlyD family secretion protein
MSRLRPIIIVLVLVAVVALAWRFWPRGHGPETLSGYVEGETLYLSAAASGTVSTVAVQRGDRVRAGAALFQIDPGTAAAVTAQAEAALRAAEAASRDAASGQRAPERAIIEAQRSAARARVHEAELAHGRVRTLFSQGFAARARLDQAQAELDTARALLRETERRLDVAALGQRQDQVAAAAARAGQARGALTEAEVRARLLAPVAPVDARVEDVFFQRGEWAPANQPVVALIPDDRVKLRFFVRETEVNRYRPGARVSFSCDSCEAAQAATVTWVSPRPEFTPPVIYSRDSRDKLVFLVEARPDRPRSLTPGLPVDVTPLAARR